MHLAQFNDSYPPVTDGVAMVMHNYALWLNRKHGSCCVVTPNHPMADDHAEFPVYRFASMPMSVEKEYMLGLPEIAFKTFHTLDTMPLDLVHTHCPFASGTLALMTARKKDIPLVATFHSKYADDFAQRLNSENAGKLAAWYTAKFFSQVDEVWAVSNGTAQTLREYGYRGPITVMPNGCDFGPTERTADNRADILRQYGLPDRPLLLFVGRLVEQKNVNLLLQATAKMASDFSLLVVGDGDHADMYHKTTAELRLNDRVRFTGAVRDRELLRKIYAASDLYVLPSVYDNAPLTVREAASCGCASALITGSNSAEGIGHDVNGFTSELSVEAYAALLDHALSNPERLREVGECARKTVYLPWETVVAHAADEYRRVIDDYRFKCFARKARPRYYSVPVAVAREALNKQAVQIKFMAKNLDRMSRQKSALAKLQADKARNERLLRRKEFRDRLYEASRKRGL